MGAVEWWGVREFAGSSDRTGSVMLRKGDPADDDTRLLESKLTSMTIGAELAQVGGVMAGEVGAVIAAILFWAGG